MHIWRIPSQVQLHVCPQDTSPWLAQVGYVNMISAPPNRVAVQPKSQPQRLSYTNLNCLCTWKSWCLCFEIHILLLYAAYHKKNTFSISWRKTPFWSWYNLTSLNSTHNDSWGCIQVPGAFESHLFLIHWLPLRHCKTQRAGHGWECLAIGFWWSSKSGSAKL